MVNALLPAAANVILRNGRDVLLIKRSHRPSAWPNFWAFPGGNVVNDEFFRETALRECEEEVGIHIAPDQIEEEVIVMLRSNQGTKVVYFCQVSDWSGIPEILEDHLATDLAWFPLDALPEPMIPHHRAAIAGIKQ